VIGQLCGCEEKRPGSSAGMTTVGSTTVCGNGAGGEAIVVVTMPIQRRQNEEGRTNAEVIAEADASEMKLL